MRPDRCSGISKAGQPCMRLGLYAGLCHQHQPALKKAPVTGPVTPPKPVIKLCKIGQHEMTEANTYVQSDGGKRCKACKAIAARRYRNEGRLYYTVRSLGLSGGPHAPKRVQKPHIKYRPRLTSSYGKAMTEAKAEFQAWDLHKGDRLHRWTERRVA